MLDHDEIKGVLIFTEEPEQKVLTPSAVLESLSPYDAATLIYLEYLINVKNSKVHLSLTVSYALIIVVMVAPLYCCNLLSYMCLQLKKINFV